MALYDRLMGFQEPKIPVHQFMAEAGEFQRGKVTSAQAQTDFGLSTSELTEAQTLLDLIIEQPESYPMGAFNTLTNVGSTFDAIAASKGLGFIVININGITQATLRVHYNKIGTGTLSWQLWNETDSTETAIANDASAAADNKSIDAVFNAGTPLTGGVKSFRVRVKSTVAADDPVYYGACLFIRRVGRLTSQELHEVLLLAEGRNAGLTTVAALKARLGVS